MSEFDKINPDELIDDVLNIIEEEQRQSGVCEGDINNLIKQCGELSMVQAQLDRYVFIKTQRKEDHDNPDLYITFMDEALTQYQNQLEIFKASRRSLTENIKKWMGLS